MSTHWRRFEQRTIFVSCSSDMAAEVNVIRTVVEELNRQLPTGDRWYPYHWTGVDETWSATGTWQENIPRASDPNVRLVICLFGERLGTALPSYFPLPAELKLPNWVAFPEAEVREGQTIPLTGTLFELLDAAQTQASQTPPELLCYLKVDLQFLSDSNLKPEEKAYGFEHLYSRLAQGKRRITPLARQEDYDNQLKLLHRFYDAFFLKPSRPYRCFGNDAAGPDGCLVELRDRLLKDLPPILGISDLKANTRELKGLAAYQPEDHDILFGRDAKIERILKHLKELAVTNRLMKSSPLLVLTGRGGEGKSSLLRAGLVGRLQQGRYPDFGRFIALVTDSLSLGKEEPVARLTEVINQSLGGRLWDGKHELIDFTPAERITKIVEGVRQALSTLKQEQRLFIGLDQFEELVVSAHENSENRARVLELLTLLRKLAEERLAWIILILPTDQLDQLTELVPDWKLPEEELGAPSDEDLRVIVERSLTVARLDTNRANIDSVVQQATDWLERQENPGPVLPLLSGLMVEMVRIRRNAWKKLLNKEDNSEGEATIDSVVNLLGERAWVEAGMERDVNPDEALARLLRQLVLTGIKEGGSFKINRLCPATHPAVVRADSLVKALKKHRLIYYPQHDSVRLAHVSIIDYWKRAATWYETEQDYQKTLVRLEDRAQNQSARPLTDEQELDEIDRLWFAWYADSDRLSHVIGLMRASLIQGFDPVARSETFEISGRFCMGLATNDAEVIDHYLIQVSAMPEGARLELIRFSDPDSGIGAIHFAAWRGNLDVFRRLISLGAEIDLPNATGQTPLWIAAHHGHSELVAALLDENVNFDQKDSDGTTPLIQAIWMRQWRIVSLLLDCGAEVNSQTLNGSTALTIAARRGEQRIVRDLLDHGAEIDLVSEEASTALAVAAENGNENIVRLLLERGARIDRATTREGTALFLAASGGHLDIVRLLLDKGANPNFPLKADLTILIAAAFNGHEAVAQLLLERGAKIESTTDSDMTTLGVAAAHGLVRLVKELLSRGADPNQALNDGQTPLSLASGAGHDEVVRCLLDHGAEIDKVGNSGQTALAVAVMNGHPTTVEVLLSRGAELYPDALMDAALLGHENVVRCLLEHGVDVDSTGTEEFTPLIASAAKGHKQVVEDLLKHGANPNYAEADAKTALSLAAELGYEEIVMLLLDHGAEVNHSDSTGMNVLASAVVNGQEAVCRLLLDNGANERQSLTPAALQAIYGDVDEDVAAGFQPIPMFAVQFGHEGILRLLLDRGADVDTLAPDGQTLLTLAARNGNAEITRLLIERNVSINRKYLDKTALEWAIENGDLGVVATLFDHGAYIDETRADGIAVAIGAAHAGQTAIVQMFLDRGISPDAAETGTNSTLLMIAAAEGNDSLAALLIERGADVDRPDSDEATPLIRAAFGNHEAVVRRLLNAGAKVQGIDDSQNTPLIGAAASGEPAMVQLLLDHGADINQRNCEGKTALEVIRALPPLRKEKMVRFLIEHGAEDNSVN